MPAGFYEGTPNDYGVKAGGEAIQKTVAAIGGIFQERYQQKQYSDFLDGPQKDYETTLHAASDLLLDETNEEGPSQAIKMMSSGLSKYMDEAGRYKNNPYIADRAHQAFVGNNTMLEQLFTSRFGAQKAANDKAKTGMEAAKTASQLQYQGAQTGLLQAQTKAIDEGKIGVGPTGKLTKGASAGKGGKAGASFLTGSPDMIDPSLSPDAQVQQAFSIASGNLTNPSSGAAQKAQEAEIDRVRNSMAQQVVSDLAGKGEQRKWVDPQTGKEMSEPWDPSNEKHVAEAAKTLVDPEDARNKYIYGKMMEEAPSTMHGVTADDIQRNMGWLSDPNLANPNAPVLREMSEANVGKILLGSEGWGKMAKTIIDPQTKAETKKQALDLTEATQNLPQSYDQIEGPMRHALDATMGSIVSGTNKPQNSQEVQKLLETTLLAVVGQYIGGGHPNAKVNEGVKKSRYAAANFAKAIAAKYADEISAKAGVIKGQPEQAQGEGFLHVTNEALKNYTPLGDLEDTASGAWQGAKGLLGKLRE